MKSQVFASLILAGLSFNALALPECKPQPLLGELRSSQAQQPQPLAEGGAERTLNRRVAEGGSEHVGGKRVAEGGAEHVGGKRIAEGGSEHVGGKRIAEGGSDRVDAAHAA